MSGLWARQDSFQPGDEVFVELPFRFAKTLGLRAREISTILDDRKIRLSVVEPTKLPAAFRRRLGSKIGVATLVRKKQPEEIPPNQAPCPCLENILAERAACSRCPTFAVRAIPGQGEASGDFWRLRAKIDCGRPGLWLRGPELAAKFWPTRQKQALVFPALVKVGEGDGALELTAAAPPTPGREPGRTWAEQGGLVGFCQLVGAGRVLWEAPRAPVLARRADEVGPGSR